MRAEDRKNRRSRTIHELLYIEKWRKEKQIENREKEIIEKQNLVNQLNEQRLKELERISQFTRDQARTELFNVVKDDIKHDTAQINEIYSRMVEGI